MFLNSQVCFLMYITLYLFHCPLIIYQSAPINPANLDNTDARTKNASQPSVKLWCPDKASTSTLFILSDQ